MKYLKRDVKNFKIRFKTKKASVKKEIIEADRDQVIVDNKLIIDEQSQIEIKDKIKYLG